MRTLLDKIARVCKWLVYPLLVVQAFTFLLLIVCMGNIDAASLILAFVELGMLGLIFLSFVYSWFCDRVKRETV